MTERRSRVDLRGISTVPVSSATTRAAGGHRPRRGFRLLGISIVAALLALGATACEPPRPVDKSRPILFVHGWNLGGGVNCGGNFDRMISQLRNEGFTGPMIKVGFYTGDTNCDMSLRSWGSFENGSSWKEVSKAFSKYVHATFTSKGVAVDVVGHSMGGNIVRGAVYGSSIGEAGFSAPIRVQDAVTLGAPHAGAAWYSSFCLWGQCSSLKPGATDIKWLLRDGDPQGLGGTEWTAFGSTTDDVVPDLSALYMAIAPERKIKYSDVEHSAFLSTPKVVTRAGTALAQVNA